MWARVCRAFLFVNFITKSFLTYSFFLPIPVLSTISRLLSSSMCSITAKTANVGLHRIGNKPLSEQILAQFPDTYMWHWGIWVKHNSHIGQKEFIYFCINRSGKQTKGLWINCLYIVVDPSFISRTMFHHNGSIFLLMMVLDQLFSLFVQLIDVWRWSCVSQLRDYYFRWWLVDHLVPSHYLTQCRLE